VNARRRRTPAAAPQPGGRRLGRVWAWRDAHLYSLLSSFGRIGTRPWATALTVGVMAIALALPLCLMLVLDEVGRFSGSLRDSRELAVFLQPDADQAAAEVLAAELAADPRLSSLQLRSPEQGLEELRAVQDLAGALDVLEQNPLPYVLLATPAAGIDEAALVSELRARPEADFVQHDAQWRQRLSGWLALGQRFAQVVAALLALGVLLVVGNTVRLDIHGRADEIATLRLLGATDGFVRRPFLYLGAWYGALAGVFALLLALAARGALEPAVASLVSSYSGDFALATLRADYALLLLCGSIALGWIGAYLAVGHHLRHVEGSE
jgi:cell division transport system permease protein